MWGVVSLVLFFCSLHCQDSGLIGEPDRSLVRHMMHRCEPQEFFDDMFRKRIGQNWFFFMEKILIFLG